MRRSDDTGEIFTAGRLGAGFVAILAVGGLLQLLNHLIGETLDGNVTKAWVAARQLARNTQALQHVKPTREHAANLVEELERHQQQRRRESG
jgi:hypothetical protein